MRKGVPFDHKIASSEDREDRSPFKSSGGLVARIEVLSLSASLAIPAGKMEEEGEGLRARSFRNEDYNTRRVFLRSYPLRWGDDSDGDQEERGDEGQLRGGGGGGGDAHKGWVAPLKRRMAGAVFRWRGDTAVLVRKIKNKVAFYLFACRPFGFKPPHHHHHPPSPGC